MLKTLDTFSANSLKILDKDINEFIKKYIYNLSFYKKDSRSSLGQQFHSLICSYLKGYNVDKLINEFNEPNKTKWLNLKNILEKNKQNFIEMEYSFLIKEELLKKPYYLTGRFDAIYKENNIYTIYDWKTLNLPKDYKHDLQTIVYLYCSSKIFNTEKIKIKYLSIEKLNFLEVEFENSQKYKNIIEKIISKYYNLTTKN